jgi:hypothetical protein
MHTRRTPPHRTRMPPPDLTPTILGRPHPHLRHTRATSATCISPVIYRAPQDDPHPQTGRRLSAATLPLDRRQKSQVKASYPGEVEFHFRSPQYVQSEFELKPQANMVVIESRSDTAGLTATRCTCRFFEARTQAVDAEKRHPGEVAPLSQGASPEQADGGHEETEYRSRERQEGENRHRSSAGEVPPFLSPQPPQQQKQGNK